MKEKVSPGLRELIKKDKPIVIKGSMTVQEFKEAFEKMWESYIEQITKKNKEREGREKRVNNLLKELNETWEDLPAEVAAYFVQYIHTNRAYGSWYIDHLTKEYPKYFT